MQQFFMGLVLVLGIACYWLYNANQTLTANNIALEGAIAQQEEAMKVMKESYEKQGQALMNMSRKNAEIEAEKAEYLAIFARHNLDMLAIKKPGLIENRFNGASVKVMEGIEDDTKELYNLTNPSDSD